MKQLEITNRRTFTTLREKVDGKEVYYQYDKNDGETAPASVNFSTQGKDDKILSGSYSQGGGFVLNGNRITQAEDLEIIQKVFATILMIIGGEIEEVNNEV